MGARGPASILWTIIPSAGFLRRVFLRRGRLKTNPLRGLPRTDYIRDRNWLYQVTQGMLTRPDFFRTDT